MEERGTISTRWERRSDLPLTVLALAFLLAYAWPILNPRLSQPARVTCTVVTIGSWAAFAVDYAVRWWLAEHRAIFVRKHLFDLAVIVLPIMRPLRALRLVTALNVLNRKSEADFRGRVVLYTVCAAGLIAFTAALAVLDAERRSHHANISNFGDALWWALTTMTTVGYGDRFPTTTQGRFIGAALMLFGIALVGIVTATFASWMVARVREVEAAEQLTQSELQEILAEVRALRQQLKDGSSE